MHPDPAFREADRDQMRLFAKDAGFGMLFAQTQEGPRVVHTPFVFLDDNQIAFHLSRNNAITPYLDTATALFVINGPDGYISPDWYGIDDQVPTWNYIAIELEGVARKLTKTELIAQADALSAINESRLFPKPAWTRDKMSAGRFEAMLGGITGFALEITQWRSTIKLGQNKPAAVRLAAADGAQAAGHPAIAHSMRTLAP